MTGTPAPEVQTHTSNREEAIDEARTALEDTGGGTLYIHETVGSVQQQQLVD